jgi:hypothetical protein
MFGRSMMTAMPVVVMPMRTVRWSKDNTLRKVYRQRLMQSGGKSGRKSGD